MFLVLTVVNFISVQVFFVKFPLPSVIVLYTQVVKVKNNYKSLFSLSRRARSRPKLAGFLKVGVSVKLYLTKGVRLIN